MKPGPPPCRLLLLLMDRKRGFRLFPTQICNKCHLLLPNTNLAVGAARHNHLLLPFAADHHVRDFLRMRGLHLVRVRDRREIHLLLSALEHVAVVVVHISHVALAQVTHRAAALAGVETPVAHTAVAARRQDVASRIYESAMRRSSDTAAAA